MNMAAFVDVETMLRTKTTFREAADNAVTNSDDNNDSAVADLHHQQQQQLCEHAFWQWVMPCLRREPVGASPATRLVDSLGGDRAASLGPAAHAVALVLQGLEMVKVCALSSGDGTADASDAAAASYSKGSTFHGLGLVLRAIVLRQLACAVGVASALATTGGQQGGPSNDDVDSQSQDEQSEAAAMVPLMEWMLTIDELALRRPWTSAS